MIKNRKDDGLYKYPMYCYEDLFFYVDEYNKLTNPETNKVYDFVLINKSQQTEIKKLTTSVKEKIDAKISDLIEKHF